MTDPREADVGSILGWTRRARSQPPAGLAAVVDAGLVGDDDINVGKVRAFAQRGRSDLEIDGIAVGAAEQMVAVGNTRLEPAASPSRSTVNSGRDQSGMVLRRRRADILPRQPLALPQNGSPR